MGAVSVQVSNILSCVSELKLLCSLGLLGSFMYWLPILSNILLVYLSLGLIVGLWPLLAMRGLHN